MASSFTPSGGDFRAQWIDHKFLVAGSTLQGIVLAFVVVTKEAADDGILFSFGRESQRIYDHLDFDPSVDPDMETFCERIQYEIFVKNNKQLRICINEWHKAVVGSSSLTQFMQFMEKVVVAGSLDNYKRFSFRVLGRFLQTKFSCDLDSQDLKRADYACITTVFIEHIDYSGSFTEREIFLKCLAYLATEDDRRKALSYLQSENKKAALRCWFSHLRAVIYNTHYYYPRIHVKDRELLERITRHDFSITLLFRFILLNWSDWARREYRRIALSEIEEVFLDSGLRFSPDRLHRPILDLIVDYMV